MGLLDTAVDPRTQSYLDARVAMLSLLAELERALDAAREGGGERAVTRHHARGKLLARERVELLVDRDTPLLELSPVAGWGTGTPVGAAVVTAVGVVEDLPCVIIASDPTVRGGAVHTCTLRKIQRALRIAQENRLPVISLLEADGYEPAEHPEIMLHAGQVVAGFAQLAAAGVPTAGTFFGGSTSLAGVDLAESFDYLVALPGPASVRSVDHRAEDERDALRLTRQCVLRFRRAPATRRPSGPAAPVTPPAYDPDDLLAVPTTEPREILGRVLDGSEFDEVRPGSGGALCAGWGTVHGYPVAVLADGGGVAGSDEAEKAARLIRRAGAARTPLLLLRHGAAPPPDAEAAVARVVTGEDLPLVTVRVGGWRGPSAVDARARFRFAWPHPGTTAAGTPPGAAPADGTPPDTTTPGGPTGARSGARSGDLAGDLANGLANRLTGGAATGTARSGGTPTNGLTGGTPTGTARSGGAGPGAARPSALQLSGRLDDDGVVDPRDTRTVLGLCLALIGHAPR
jgi:acetyl-CoA carboxylase carboxyltransferase component